MSFLNSATPTTVNRVKRNTSISGNCFFKFKNDDYRYPLKFKRLSLNRDGIEIVQGSTSADGSFVISHYLENGNYQLIVTDGTYRAEKDITITDYKVENIELVIEKIK